MGELVANFEAIDSSGSNSFVQTIVIGIVLIVLAGGALFLKNKLNYNYRLLLSMLFFFFGIIAFSKAFFTKLTSAKIGNFEIYEKGIITPDRSIPFSSLVDAYIYNNQQARGMNPNKVSQGKKVLIIEYNTDQKFTLSEDHYPVEEIFEKLKEVVNRE